MLVAGEGWSERQPQVLLPGSGDPFSGLPGGPSHPNVWGCQLAGWRRPRLLLHLLAGRKGRLPRRSVKPATYSKSDVISAISRELLLLLVRVAGPLP